MEDSARQPALRDTDAQGRPATQTDQRHETRDVNLRLIGLAAGLLIAGAVGIELVLGLTLVSFRRSAPPSAAIPIRSAQQPPPPRLWQFPEPNRRTPRQNYEALRREEDRILTTSGAADAANGGAHIPLEQAKELLLSHPPPTRAGGQPAPEDMGESGSGAAGRTGAARANIGPTGRNP